MQLILIFLVIFALVIGFLHLLQQLAAKGLLMFFAKKAGFYLAVGTATIAIMSFISLLF